MVSIGGITSGDQHSGGDENIVCNINNVCRDYIKGCCSRESCRFIHEIPPKSCLKELFKFCHDYQNKGCFRSNCKFIHASVELQEYFYSTGVFPQDSRSNPPVPPPQSGQIEQEGSKYNAPDVDGFRHIPPPCFSIPPPNMQDDRPPEAKLRKMSYEEDRLKNIARSCFQVYTKCYKCDIHEHKVRILHDNITVLIKKVADLTEKNAQLASMNDFLLEQTASMRGEQSCVITSRHGTSAPVSLATVSMTPVVSLAGALPTLVPAAATPNLTLAPAASRAQLLTPAPQILTVSTTQQLVGNSGALIVTSAGAQQLMQVSDSGTLMGGGQTVVAVTPAQLTLAPQPQQLMSTAAPTAVQQLVQQSAQQLVPSHSAQQYAAAQQSVQHLAAQQSAQHLAVAQQSAQHLAAQQSAQQLAAQQLAAQQSAQTMLESAQQLAVQQSAQLTQQSGPQLVTPAPQLVHQTSTQQITISSTSQPITLPNSQAQGITWDRPMISQNILPH